MIYETRVYRCLPGRLPALLKRFETITLKLWEKHGIRQAGFFTTLVGEFSAYCRHSSVVTLPRPWSAGSRRRSHRGPAA